MRSCPKIRQFDAQLKIAGAYTDAIECEEIFMITKICFHFHFSFALPYSRKYWQSSKNIGGALKFDGFKFDGRFPNRQTAKFN